MKSIALRFCEEDPLPRLEILCGREELTRSSLRLASFPGSAHWHLSRPGERGTLEVTWWPKGRRLWVKVASNREGLWIDGAIAALVREFGLEQESQ